MPLEETARDWFAVQVWASREQQCEKHLVVRGYDVFLPRYRDRRRWSDRVQTIERPLFPGYVFCRLSPTVFGKVVTAPHVIAIVGDGQHPIPIAPHEIAALQRITESRLAAEPWEYLREGQAVSIIEGPLRGVEGIVLKAKNRHRLVVSVSLLQRAVAVEIAPDALRLSSAASLIADVPGAAAP